MSQLNSLTLFGPLQAPSASIQSLSVNNLQNGNISAQVGNAGALGVGNLFVSQNAIVQSLVANQANLATLSALSGNIAALTVGTISSAGGGVLAVGQLAAQTGNIGNLVSANFNANTGNVASFSANNAAIGSLAAQMGNITTLSTQVANVANLTAVSETVGTIVAQTGTISTLSSLAANIAGLSAQSGNVTTFSSQIANISNLAVASETVGTIVAQAGSVNTLSGQSANIASLTVQNGNVNTLSSQTAYIGGVTAQNGNITTLASQIANIANLTVGTITSAGGGVLAVGQIAAQVATFTFMSSNTSSLGNVIGPLTVAGDIIFTGNLRQTLFSNTASAPLNYAFGNVSANNLTVSSVANVASLGAGTIFSSNIVGYAANVSIINNPQVFQSVPQALGMQAAYFIGNALSQNQCGFITYGSTYAPGTPGGVGVGVYGITSGITVSPAGNVGINTTNPAYPLDVGGSSRITGSLIQTNPVYGQYNMAAITVNNQIVNNWPYTLASGNIPVNASGLPVAPYTGFYSFHINFWGSAQNFIELFINTSGSQNNRVVNYYAAAGVLNLTRFVMGGSLYLAAGDVFNSQVSTNANTTLSQGNGPAFALFLMQRTA